MREAGERWAVAVDKFDFNAGRSPKLARDREAAADLLAEARFRISELRFLGIHL